MFCLNLEVMKIYDPKMSESTLKHLKYVCIQFNKTGNLKTFYQQIKVNYLLPKMKMFDIKHNIF